MWFASLPSFDWVIQCAENPPSGMRCCFLFLEGTSPVSFPVCPSLVGASKAVPFLPSVGEGTALEGMFCARGDHGCFEDVNVAVVGEFLAVLLFANVDN